MIQQEAEEAAARRNREDSRRDRFVFYALDESAGIAPDAWEVAMRLRRDGERPRRKSRARPASIPPPAPRESRETATAVAEPAVEAPAPVAWESLEPTEVYDLAAEPIAEQEPAPDAPKPAPEPESEPVRRRRFGLVRLWGVFVVLVGLAFIAAVLIVAFTFEDYTHLSTLTWGTGVAIGAFAVGVGIALTRRRR